INSAIDELIPARVRGRVNLIINGSFWVGAVVGSGATVVLLDPRLLAVDLGWRLGFGIGVALGLMVLIARRHVPESPRWLSVHGYRAKAERVMAEIETRIARATQGVLPPARETMTIQPRRKTELSVVFKTMFTRYRSRSILGFVLIASQAFLYNAIFFTYALVLRTFYDVPAQHTGLYLMPFAIANFLGPLILGHWFDSVGRRVMIAATYSLSGALLLMTGGLFAGGMLSAYGQTALWAAIFFFASAAASSAYLTVSEIFPLELRAIAIAVFFAVGTGVGGVLAPWLFGLLIGSGSRMSVFGGYAFGSCFMLVAAAVALKLGVNAERVSLEGVATPLSAEVQPPR
ncbi:MAG TPA: MFS transporter, partial [Burkholderiales bacterium]|nr:MFS transporter [Burkholderiales bacterium]